MFVEGNYLIFYRLADQDTPAAPFVLIVAVLHGAQDIDAALGAKGL
jgi:plasmid stabilization system protein ParE